MLFFNPLKIIHRNKSVDTKYKIMDGFDQMVNIGFTWTEDII